MGREIVLDVHTQLALGKVPDVPHGGFDQIIRPQVAVDRMRFGGRFDDDERFLHLETPLKVLSRGLADKSLELETEQKAEHFGDRGVGFLDQRIDMSQRIGA